MSNYSLVSDRYITVTPSGAYYAATGNRDDAAQNLIEALLRLQKTPLLDDELLSKLLPKETQLNSLELLYRMQSVGWIEGKSEPSVAPELNMEIDVPPLLGMLSDENCALLSDAEGFYLANFGFPHELVEELSVLAAEMASINHRHQLMVRNNLRIQSSGWATVDASGNCQLGYWPIQISQQVFVLLIKGNPSFNQQGFTNFIWWLVRRYSKGS